MAEGREQDEFPPGYEAGPGQGCAPWCEYEQAHDGPCEPGREQWTYDGSFDLSFLRDDETVASTGDGTGDCWVERHTAPGQSIGVRIRVGERVQRMPNGVVVSLPATAREQTAASGREADR